MKTIGWLGRAAVACAVLANSAVLAQTADGILSKHVREADGTTAQDTNNGAGIKTGHLQNGAVSEAKIATGAVTNAKIGAGAVTDAKIAGPISASKIQGGVFQTRPAYVITVAKSGGDFTDPVTALASISDAGINNRYLVRIMPGVYDIGAVSLQMKPYVDVEGSGQGVTVVAGTVPDDAATSLPSVGVVNVEQNSELRNLTVEHRGVGTAVGYGTAVRMMGGSMRQVTASANFSLQNRAISPQGSSPLIADCTALAVAGPGRAAYGLFLRQGTGAIVSNSQIRVTGVGGDAIGIYAFNYTFGLQVQGSTVVVDGDSGIAMALDLYDSSAAVRDSRLEVTSAASGVSAALYNYHYWCTGCRVTVEASALVGGNNVVYNHARIPYDNLFIANSRLAGGPFALTSNTRCVGNYDGSFAPILCQ